MTTTTKLLCISLASLVVGLAFVTGIVNVQNTAAFYVALPLGAVFLGLFLISKLLEKEASLYDAEQRTDPAFRKVEAIKPPAADRISAGSAKTPASAAR
jgi:hypothetical protein